MQTILLFYLIDFENSVDDYIAAEKRRDRSPVCLAQPGRRTGACGGIADSPCYR